MGLLDNAMSDNILTLEYTQEHAKLSASGSHRWVLCAGSVAAEEGLKRSSSVYANEGTLAHTLAERIYFKKDYADLNVPDEMVDYVQMYINHLNCIFAYDNLLLFMEKRVDYSHVAKGGFGTADAIVINQHDGLTTLHVIDLKYGKGVKTEAFRNTQLILYALGALNTLKSYIEFPIDQIHLEIVQPRMNNFSKWTISFDELKFWEGYLKAKAEAALQLNAPRTPSDEACQWCAAFSTCPAVNQFVEELPLDKENLSEDEIKKILDNSKLIMKFLTKIEEDVYNTLSAGKPFKGYKLIEGKGVRKLKEDAEEKIVEILGSEAYDNKLLGIIKLEKLLGKDLLNSLTYYSQNRPLLVKEDDKRAAIEREELNFDYEV
jgi:hypothetical protein